jgi:hypothetical protein
LSLPASGKTTTVESDASGTPQNVQFLAIARQILAGRKRDSTNALTSLSTSCEAADSPVRAAIECNDDVASVNVALGQVVHNGC